MPLTLTSNVARDKNRVAQASPWVYLIELQIEAATCIRIVADYDATLGYQGQTWYPLRVKVSDVKRSADGRIDDATLTLSNARRLFLNYLDGTKIVGKRCRLIVLDVAEAGDATAGIESTFTVNEFSTDVADFTVRIGTGNPQAAAVPGERFYRTFCRYLHEYGSASLRCGYDSTLPGALPSCDGTLEGANGCRAHGVDEVARGLPRLHPRRGGFFPGMPEGPIDV